MTQYLTTTNFNSSNNKQNLYIVIHYTANNGDTALNNAKYFHTTYRGASAHYFVDENEIVQVVLDKDIAWHCGATTYIHPDCRNANSIGIEMCSRKDSNGNYYIKDEVVSSTLSLVLELMQTYSIPASNVLRHYDVTGKTCPAPFVKDTTLWSNFQDALNTPLTLATALDLVKNKVSLSDLTLNFIQNYRYGNDLIFKIANALANSNTSNNIANVSHAKSFIKSKIDLADSTLDFLYNYIYGDDLLLKIANAL